MQAFLANLTAAVLFIHAAFGCGWHHAHGESHSHAVLSHEACCEHHCHHCEHHSDEGTPERNTPGPCCENCGVSCVYTLQPKVQVDSNFTVCWIDIVAILPAVSTSHTTIPGWLAAAKNERAAAPPLRLHLLHQLLTI